MTEPRDTCRGVNPDGRFFRNIERYRGIPLAMHKDASCAANNGYRIYHPITGEHLHTSPNRVYAERWIDDSPTLRALATATEPNPNSSDQPQPSLPAARRRVLRQVGFLRDYLNDWMIALLKRQVPVNGPNNGCVGHVFISAQELQDAVKAAQAEEDALEAQAISRALDR